MSGQMADAKIWWFGRYWNVHAKHPISGNWIRLSGIGDESTAVADADAACWRLDREYDRMRDENRV